jgi:hypothetical protein
MKPTPKIAVKNLSCFLFLTALLCAAIFVQPLFGQTTSTASQQAPSRIEITIVSAKPEMTMEFENLVKNELNPALAKAGVKWLDVWQTAGFGNEFDYVFVSPIENYAQFDGQSPLVKALGKEGAAAWYAKASKMVNNVRTMSYIVRDDLSHNTKMTALPKMAVVSRVSVAPGRNAEFENFIKNDYLPPTKQSGIAGYWVSQLQFGGNVNEYLTVTLHENFAELEKGPPPGRVLGRDGLMKLMQKMPNGVVLHQERIFARFNPELSFRPSQTASK